jgi:hypothetical protein
MSDLKALLRECSKLGVPFETTNGGHIKFLCPGGVVFAASTPSDCRAVKNIRTMLRRKGVAL